MAKDAEGDANVALIRFNNLIKNVKYNETLSFIFVLSPERLKSIPGLFYRDIKTTKRRTFRDPRTNVWYLGQKLLLILLIRAIDANFDQ